MKKVFGVILSFVGEEIILKWLIDIKGRKKIIGHLVNYIGEDVLLKKLLKWSGANEIIYLTPNNCKESKFDLIKLNGAQYLIETGWINSFTTKSPTNKDNKPIPWVTYSYIDFIQDRLSKTLDMLEYGSGASTFYYADYVNSVTTIEHDYEWYKKVKVKAPSNVDLIFEELEYGGKYSQKASELNKKFNIIVVDGRDRVNCCINSVSALADNGVLVLDDSEREQYKTVHSFLASKGFRKIDFWGIAPGIFFNKSTSIFYRDYNCLGI